MKQKNLRMTQQTESGLNVEFVNLNSGRHISRQQAITQIKNGNPSYDGYHVVNNPKGPDFIRSNPDSKQGNNLE
ncbi:MAG: DUF3892 domain-containing protein [Peptococcaceae bacterium]|nr:DUF3892 domain-containing protein [Peptococcaceae bacterium]